MFRRVFGKLRTSLLATTAAGVAQGGFGADLEKRLPNEYETASVYGSALSNGGCTGIDPVGAIRTNPALLAASKTYQVSGAYQWPGEGREFYQAAVVDSKTSSTAAGFSYTGFMSDYRYHAEDREASRSDSPLVRRGVLGLGQKLEGMAVGVGATYVEALPLWSRVLDGQDSDDRTKGFGINAGLSFPFGGAFVAGASAENISNRRIQDYAPRVYRAGLAFSISKELQLTADYRQRQRIADFEPTGVVKLDAPAETRAEKDEQMVIAGVVAQVQDYLRLLGSYGKDMTSDRLSAAGGAALTGKNYSLTYTIARPYFKDTAATERVGLAVDVAL